LRFEIKTPASRKKTGKDGPPSGEKTPFAGCLSVPDNVRGMRETVDGATSGVKTALKGWHSPA
jgi:hypothetical protein